MTIYLSHSAAFSIFFLALGVISLYLGDAPQSETHWIYLVAVGLLALFFAIIALRESHKKDDPQSRDSRTAGILVVMFSSLYLAFVLFLFFTLMAGVHFLYALEEVSRDPFDCGFQHYGIGCDNHVVDGVNDQISFTLVNVRWSDETSMADISINMSSDSCTIQDTTPNPQKIDRLDYREGFRVTYQCAPGELIGRVDARLGLTYTLANDTSKQYSTEGTLVGLTIN